MRAYLFVTAIFLSIGMMANAQQSYTLSGTLSDNQTGEVLIGAALFERDLKTGTVTNTYGFYSLTLPEGKHKIEISYVGYQNMIYEIDLKEDVTMNFKMKPRTTDLKEIVVNAKRLDDNISSTQMGVERIDMKEIEKMPVLLGEKDILKTIQLMPGISTTSEGGSGFSVRGGKIDQNLILLDEAPVYSGSHLMGFFSVFNSDAIKNVSVYKGGIPAKYGGRGSSVVDISMKEGNNQNLSMAGGIGLISSRLAVEGPIIKDKMSFIVSGRRTYLDLLAKSVGALESGTTIYFYDLNTKVNYKLNDKNRIMLSGYFGEDKFGFNGRGMNWSNSTGTLRWNHIFNSKLFSNTSLIYSKYDYGFNLGPGITMSSGIENVAFKQDMSWYTNPNNNIKFGVNATYHTFNPGELLTGESSREQIVLGKKKALESAVYISNNQKINEYLSADYGLRYSSFLQMGEGWEYSYNENNERVDSKYYEANEIIQSYANFEPRVSVNYRLSEKSSIKASYNYMAQYLHLLSNSTSGQPTDTWIPSSSNVKPLTVAQYSAGYFRNFQDNKYEFSIEMYYKDMDNLTDFQDGTDILLNENIEAYILSGKGRSYGTEFFLKKTQGRFTGWISYTLSKTENKIDQINNNNWYSSKLDKTHDVSVVGSYELSKRLSLSATWIYYTGNAVTFPSGKYTFDNRSLSYYTERNGYRMPDYHRLDLNLHLKGKKREKFETSWDFSLYNAYHRLNAYSISFQESETTPGVTEAVKMSLFGIVPSISWNFKY